MTNAWESYGATRRGNKILAARVENNGARLLITSLKTSDDNLNGDTMASGRLFFGVDERQAIIKKIAVRKNSGIDAARVAEFELEQSLLENPDQYYFDFLPIDENGPQQRIISIAYHRRRIDEAMEEYTRLLRKPSGFKLDAVALAAGYLNFCRSEPGKLQILLDVDRDGAVMTILVNGTIRACDRIALAGEGELEISRARQLTSELKLTVNYHLDELFREGITVPPSRIILTGNLAGNRNLLDAIGERFATEIKHPQINEGYFGGQKIDNWERAADFLIPLGLAVA